MNDAQAVGSGRTRRETVKTVQWLQADAHTPLKRGVNKN